MLVKKIHSCQLYQRRPQIFTKGTFETPSRRDHVKRVKRQPDQAKRLQPDHLNAAPGNAEPHVNPATGDSEPHLRPATGDAEPHLNPAKEDARSQRAPAARSRNGSRRKPVTTQVCWIRQAYVTKQEPLMLRIFGETRTCVLRKSSFT